MKADIQRLSHHMTATNHEIRKAMEKNAASRHEENDRTEGLAARVLDSDMDAGLEKSK